MNYCKLIPVPKNYIKKDGIKKFEPRIQCEIEQWKPLASAFIESVQKIYDITLTEGTGGIQVILDENIGQESYVLDTLEEVKILASDYQGCAYALATVLQLMNANLEIEEARIEDKPDKDYRGLMIDLARKWHPFRTLLHYVDLCFFYKIKYLHLHFMDSESYTLPSKVLPNLPTKDRSYSTQEIELLRSYAESRGVVLVPEIEMPGHARVLVKAYPDLFANCFDEESSEAAAIGTGVVVKDDAVICVGSESAFVHITELIDEVMSLFPNSPYIHLGADEVNTEVWKHCPMCREYMRNNQIKDTEDLYSEFVARVTNYVLSKGRRPIVWEGFKKEYSGRISKDVIVNEFESYYQNPDEVVEGGFQVINCSWKPLYVVPFLFGMPRWDVFDILKWNVYEWQSWVEKSEATLNPFHLAPTEQIIGGQLCAWEMTYECEIALVVVMLAALSERTWSVKRYCNDEEFWKKLDVQMKKAFKLIADK